MLSPTVATTPVLGATRVLGASDALGSGWFFDLLRKAGVSPDTANTVVEFVLRPAELVLVVVIGVLLAHFGARALRRWLGRLTQQAAGRSASPRASARAATVSALAANLWRFVVALVVVAIGLGILGINLTPLLASATVIGATIGFGAQSLVRDYLSGALLTMEDQFGIGDSIWVNGTAGVVEDVSLRVTRVRAFNGTLWYVPNGDIRLLGNTSRGWAKAVVEVALSPVAAAGPRADEVRRSVLGAAGAVARSAAFAASCPEPPDVVGFVDADQTSYTLRVQVRTQPEVRDALERAVREAVLDRLVAEGLWPAPAAPAPGPPGPALDAGPDAR
ncbi:MAG TPA: mechanosensitive ion channel domain-containing protein [Acidimicrobiales bacterium]|jgi:small conductance mechanosensitive channel